MLRSAPSAWRDASSWALSQGVLGGPEPMAGSSMMPSTLTSTALRERRAMGAVGRAKVALESRSMAVLAAGRMLGNDADRRLTSLAALELAPPNRLPVLLDAAPGWVVVSEGWVWLASSAISRSSSRTASLENILRKRGRHAANGDWRSPAWHSVSRTPTGEMVC